MTATVDDMAWFGNDMVSEGEVDKDEIYFLESV